MKLCTKCGIEKDESEFSKCSAKKDGLTPHCKLCVKEYNKQYREYNAEQLVIDKHNFYIEHKEDIYAYRAENKESIKEYQKEYDKKYREENKEKKHETDKKYYEENRESIRATKRIYENNRRKTDILYRLTGNIRGLINMTFKNRGYTKNSKSSIILGCTYEEFVTHIESKFQEGMSWENRSLWHLDHIYPVSRAIDEEHLIQLNHYTNFQPLWAEDNLRKSNKLLDIQL